MAYKLSLMKVLSKYDLEEVNWLGLRNFVSHEVA